MKEYKKMLKNMFWFEGRARRREFWVVSLINSAISCFLYALMFFASTFAGDALCYTYTNGAGAGFDTTGSVVGTIFVVPIVIFMIYIIVSTIGLTVRRYHDAGIPGWVYPICLAGCCLCGIGAIAHLVICFLPSKEDNQYGVNPKAPQNNEYEDGAGIVIAVVLYVICLFLVIAGVAFNVAKCGLKGSVGSINSTSGLTGEENDICEDPSSVFESNVDSKTEEEEDIPSTNTGTEEDIVTEKSDTSSADGSYNLTIGASILTLTPPAAAEDVYASDYMISYSYKDINVQYSDSFCEVTEDAISFLKDSYEIHKGTEDDMDTSASVEPTETMVGNNTAYYFKVSTAYSDYEYVYYGFLVDIGAENYLEVTVSGMSNGFTDADAFEIADLKL